MIIAGSILYLDPYTQDIIEKSIYYRELHGTYFMNVGKLLMEELEREN